MQFARGNPREFWKSLRPLMHTRRRVPDDFIVKEKEKVIKEQSQVAETFNEYFTNITKDLIVHKHTAFRDQAHYTKFLWRVSDRRTLLDCS